MSQYQGVFRIHDSPAARRTRISRAGIPALALLLGLLPALGCGDYSLDNRDKALSTCEDLGLLFHFRVMAPPWKHSKEYRCTSFESGKCVGTWIPTGRYVYVVSDVPFVNFDSEIITSLDVEVVSGDTAALVWQVIETESIGDPGSTASFYGSDADYPRVVDPTAEGGLSGHEILWRQERTFQGASYNWYRRDVFLTSAGTTVYRLRLFSIGRLDLPEFEALVRSFKEGRSPDGAPHCKCRDEHDPSGPQDC